MVIATTDNNSQVSGRGIERMRAAGIDVKVGVLQDEAYRLNSAFFTVHGKNRPYVTLKWAQSADGFIDKKRIDGEAQPISNSATMLAVHKLRATHDAILVGRRTAQFDNPSLTLRNWPGHTPLRLVFDRSGTLPQTIKLFDGKVHTIVYGNATDRDFCHENISQVALDFTGNIPMQILQHLHGEKVGSLLVEGGCETLQSFIDSGLWDEIRIETNPHLLLGDGVPAPILPQGLKSQKKKSFGHIIETFMQ